MLSRNPEAEAELDQFAGDTELALDTPGSQTSSDHCHEKLPTAPSTNGSMHTKLASVFNARGFN